MFGLLVNVARANLGRVKKPQPARPRQSQQPPRRLLLLPRSGSERMSSEQPEDVPVGATRFILAGMESPYRDISAVQLSLRPFIMRPEDFES
jgi:hypothetical protein